MKKYIILVTITICSIFFIESYKTTPEIIVDANEIAIKVSEPESTDFLVARDLDGFIAIFVPDQIIPCMLTDINVKTLPLADQQMLKSGIIIDGDYGLANFLEDYSS